MSVHVWRQTQTQTTIVNFYEEDFNILNPRKNDRGNTDGYFRMEFPIMQWLVAGLYKLFGNHIFITRISMFLLGVGTILGMYSLLNSLFNNRFIGLIGAYTFTFSPCFFYYTINPLPDNMALMASTWGLALFFKWKRLGKSWLLVVSSCMFALGTLCKLPFILFYAAPGMYFIIQFIKRKENISGTLQRMIVLIISLIPPIVWYVTVIPGWKGNGVTSGVMDNRISYLSMLDILWHNLVSTLPELLLNYGSVLFFLAGFYFLFRKKLYRHPDFNLLLTLSFGLSAYFLFEINMIAKVHDYYLFPFFPMLFILVGYGAYSILQLNKRWLTLTVVIVLAVLPLLTEIRMMSRWNPNQPGVNKDLYQYKVELRNAVPKDALCVVGNDISHFIMLYYVDKKGWCFDDGKPDLNRMIQQGAEYVYLDTTKIDDLKYFDTYTDSLIMQRGTIMVYRLRR